LVLKFFVVDRRKFSEGAAVGAVEQEEGKGRYADIANDNFDWRPTFHMHPTTKNTTGEINSPAA
jgi:hypothetical protein